MGDYAIPTETEDEERRRAFAWFTSGIIVWDGMSHLVTIHRSTLVMDPRVWARAQAEAHERDAVTSTTEAARTITERIVRSLRLWASGDYGFLETSALSLSQYAPAIAVRANMGFLSVTPGNFHDYMEQVMARTIPAQRNVPPTFLLIADRTPVEMFVTQDSAHLVEFALNWVHGLVVSRRDLLHLFDEVVKDYELAHEVARAQCESRRVQGNSGQHMPGRTGDTGAPQRPSRLLRRTSRRDR